MAMSRGWVPLLSVLVASGPGPVPRTDLPLGADSGAVVLTGGSYLDVREGLVRENGGIVVNGGRIVEIHAPGTRWQPPTGAKEISLVGRTVLPGLIDAHVHLTISGPPEANAAATLRAGFTTVVDLGSANGAGVKLRDAIRRGEIMGPRIIAAGSWIGSKGGVCEFGGATVSSPAEAGARARADVDTGVDLLKVCVTGWPADAAAFPDSVEFKAPMLQAVTAVATEARLPVFAHAIGRAGALLAAAQGARALAHTPIVDSADAARLKASGIVLISTLATLTAGKEGDRLRRSFQLLHQAGVPIVLGTDAGVLPHGQNAKELAALTMAGLSPLEAFRAATLNAAALLQASDLGQIAVGSVADFVVVEGDPLADVRVLEQPVLVIQGGTVLH